MAISGTTPVRDRAERPSEQTARERSGDRVVVRAALPSDVGELTDLIARSALHLSRGYYDEAQSAAALAEVFGVDTQLIADGTYLVAEEDGAPIGCGGWSQRATLFGGDQFAARDSAPLDPATDAARIRAFFVDPAHARRGVATRLLDACEQAARAAGFSRLALMATLPGIPFYRAHGFAPGDALDHRAGGVTIPFLSMTKELHDIPDERWTAARQAERETRT